MPQAQKWPWRWAVLSNSWCVHVLKLFRVTVGNVHSFQIHSKEALLIMYPKYLVLDMMKRIYLHCGSLESIIRVWIQSKNVFALVDMTFGLVHASNSLSRWQAVKLTKVLCTPFRVLISTWIIKFLLWHDKSKQNSANSFEHIRSLRHKHGPPQIGHTRDRP